MASIAVYNFSLRRGDTFAPKRFVIEREGYDFTGTSIKMQVRNKTSNALICEFFPNPSYLQNQMIFILEKDAEETKNFPIGTFEYDLELTYAHGVVQTVLKGAFTVTKDITYDS